MTFWDHRYTSFAFVFFGGLAINLLRLHLMSQSSAVERPDFDWIYWSQFVGLAAMGSVASPAYDISNPISPLVAFNAGLSIPALLKTAAELQGPKKKRKTN